MNLDALDEILSGEPKYRVAQARAAVFKGMAENWNKAIGLPPKLRAKLNAECPLEITGEIMESEDGGETQKAIIDVAGGFKIETVLMRHSIGDDLKAARNTVCVSSQVGCPMGCKFCATGKAGFRRSLTAWEIVEQVLFFERALKKKKERVSNIVFMGMGEPFMNYDAVMQAVRILNSPDGMGIGARKISISTCGIVEGIKKLANEDIQVNLAISLHAPDIILRSLLMPVNRKYALPEVLHAVDYYIKKTSRQVMFEYLLLKDLNDTPEHAEALIKIMKHPLYFVNLIVFNPSGREGMQPSPAASVRRFKSILEKAGVGVSQRYRFGRGIKAACGQLVFGSEKKQSS